MSVKVVIVALILVACAVMISGCATQITGGKEVFNSGDVTVRDFGNGVLYFTYSSDNKDNFGYTLSRYISDNDVTVLAIAPDPIETAYNAFNGYWVIVSVREE
jgi:hypothetical protein